MTQEDKELLLKDLCARLPYGVKCRIDYDNEEDADLGIERYHDDRIVSVCIETGEIGLYEESGYLYLDDIKPYLLPKSSMTDEQKGDYNSLCDLVPAMDPPEIGNLMDDYELVDSWKSIDYLNANHFDYRGLIEDGLAIDATGLNIY